ncbi:MAG: hypothetical protein ACI9B7_000972 [Oleispira sp.]|jgi:hypothetical protein
MGELSKKIGEKGEKLVSEFLTTIGWANFQDGESLSCHSAVSHQLKKDSKRTTHGIDIFHSFKSQLQDFTLDNIVVSVKYTSNPYPINPTSKFKEHFKDLAHTIECYMKSDLRSQNNEDYEGMAISTANDTGVLFWLTNDRESDQDVVSKIKNINLDKSLGFSTIHIVDNARAAFIYNAIKYVRNSFSNHEIYFHYTFSSSNYRDPTTSRYGKVFPVEYLTSDIIPFRVVDNVTGKTSFCLASREEFTEESINRLLYLASDVSQDFTGDFIFLYPDYDVINHEASVKRARRIQNDKLDLLNVTVKSYSNDFRVMINE